jgi:tetratricopeptide (TPR) repeat protein
VNLSKKIRRLAGVLLGATALCLPATLSAQGTSQNPPQSQSFVPSGNELARLSMSGSYLAARHAGTQRDAGAAAAYYRAALRNDPKNNELLQRAFLSVLAEGDVEEATRLAEQVAAIDRNDRIARLVIGVKALKQKKYQAAKQNLAPPGRAMAQASPRPPSSRSTSCRARTGTRCSRTCMPA